MKRLAVLAMIALLSACGSDGPSDRFTGTWIGTALVGTTDTLHFTLASTQSGSAVTGSGTVAEGGTSEALTFTGTSTPPSLNMVFTVGSEVINYSATYVRSDSVTGTLSEGSNTAPLSLGRH